VKLVKRDDGWWIAEVPGGGDCGPYATKAEADEDRRGLERTEKNKDRRSFFTSERRK